MNQELFDFLKKSPTAFHAVDTIRRALDAEGFTALSECEPWSLEAGGRYYVSRNGSSLICFRVGEEPEPYHFQIAAAHTDAPAFKLKENGEIHLGGHYSKLNTEGYGGMICASWLDRPLSVAGRVLVRTPKGIESRLLTVDRDLLLIPSVAIHMNPKVNEGTALNKQVDLLPLYGADTPEGSFRGLIARELQVEEGDILGSDLFLYSRAAPCLWGIQNEFLSGPHLDDLQCVFGILKGFLSANGRQGVNVAAFFDNEEVGSVTRQGAASTFLGDVLTGITCGLGKTAQEHRQALAASFMVSADNAHAVHPNHPELTDATNCVYLNQGVVVKSHAGQRYTSDGLSIAVVRELASRAQVPLQYFANRSDKSGGSTLGNIAVANVSVPCVDIGLPQLAMHASYETAGALDTGYLVKLMETFYAARIIVQGDGCLSV